jgi:uncharacterized protein
MTIQNPHYAPSPSIVGHDIFAVNNGVDDFIIYAPLRQILFRANGQAVKTLHDYLEGNESLSQDEIIVNAERMGLFSPLDDSKLSSLFNQQWQPLSAVTIALTYSCNLNCIYCYANGGDYIGKVDNEVIKASIEFAAQNSKSAGYDFLRLGFHGTGEATLEWEKLKYAVQVAEETATREGLKPYISVTTNGTRITREMADFIVQHDLHISISLDGYDEIQNHQRPTRGGKGSFDSIVTSLRNLQEKNIYFSFRATVLPENIDKLSKIVQFLHDDIFLGKKGKIIFEPAENVGRATKSNLQELNPDLFIENYKQAVSLGEQLGIKVTCSADLRFGFRRSFCDANGRIFLVLPTGEISSCTRVTTQNDALAPIFHYGYYDNEKKTFVINEQKLQNLVDLDLHRNEQCSKCYCKWHCAGQCLAANYSDDGHWEKMCYITRELAKWRLNSILDAQ